MNTLPTWMRTALFATAAMNIVAAAAFLPGARGLRALVGLPEAGHPVYLLTVGMFILLFGIGYLVSALTNHADRLFIALAAAGKLSVVTLLTVFWATGSLPPQAPLAATGDLIFGVLFLKWLLAG